MNYKEDLSEEAIKYAETDTTVERDLSLKPSRYSICKACDRFNTSFKLCKECGCFMPMKTLIKNESCPLNKW